MLKAHDYECAKCGFIEEQMLEDGDALEPCSKCGSIELKKLITKCSFKLLYDPKKHRCSWSFDNYNESQYWKDVNAARSRGEDVVPAHELMGKSTDFNKK